MAAHIRNRGCVPFLGSEGVFEKPLTKLKVDDRREDWYAGLSPYQRLHMHHTLASARRYAYFKPFPN
ncbi:hypothetical protein NQ318_006776 [Aromia moschata]|uniref:Uncharacterized protein n=1 Tax=Aromia moschata TaxID=1265417 RepID=A0AAV8Y7J1_9CUCU|nr:hypothetical protein NQ318_006776 [Aromia moschata]